MNQVTIEKSRRIAQTKTKAFKSNIIPKGATLEIQDYVKKTSPDGRAVDFLLCNHVGEGKTIKLTVAEFNQMETVEGSNLVASLENGQEAFPKSITISSSKDKLDRDGNKYYPAYAYNKADEFYESLTDEDTPNMEWSELVASEVREDNTTDPIQEYTVSTQF